MQLQQKHMPWLLDDENHPQAEFLRALLSVVFEVLVKTNHTGKSLPEPNSIRVFGNDIVLRWRDVCLNIRGWEMDGQVENPPAVVVVRPSLDDYVFNITDARGATEPSSRMIEFSRLFWGWM